MLKSQKDRIVDAVLGRWETGKVVTVSGKHSKKTRVVISKRGTYYYQKRKDHHK